MLLAYTFGQGLATAALATFVFVWLLVAVRIIRRDDVGVLGKILWIVAIVAILAIMLVGCSPPSSGTHQGRARRSG